MSDIHEQDWLPELYALAGERLAEPAGLEWGDCPACARPLLDGGSSEWAESWACDRCGVVLAA